MISLDDFRARTRNSEPARERVQQLRADVREGVRAQALTGHPEWDHYLESVEASIAQFRNMAAIEQAKMNNPLTVNQDEIMVLKIKIACASQSVAVLEDIIKLPKMLLERGRESSEALRNLEPE